MSSRWRMHFCFLWLFFLFGCSNQDFHASNVQLGSIKNLNVDAKGYEKKIKGFIYLLNYAVNDMLIDINNQVQNCKNDPLTLNLSLKYEDPYQEIKHRSSLNKKASFLSLKYELTDASQNKTSGEITALDSFVIPHTPYGYVLSIEDSQIAIINNLVKQLEMEVIYYLRNRCK